MISLSFVLLDSSPLYTSILLFCLFSFFSHLFQFKDIYLFLFKINVIFICAHWSSFIFFLLFFLRILPFILLSLLGHHFWSYRFCFWFDRFWLLLNLLNLFFILRCDFILLFLPFEQLFLFLDFFFQLFFKFLHFNANSFNFIKLIQSKSSVLDKF